MHKAFLLYNGVKLPALPNSLSGDELLFISQDTYGRFTLYHAQGELDFIGVNYNGSTKLAILVKSPFECWSYSGEEYVWVDHVSTTLENGSEVAVIVDWIIWTTLSVKNNETGEVVLRPGEVDQFGPSINELLHNYDYGWYYETTNSWATDVTGVENNYSPELRLFAIVKDGCTPTAQWYKNDAPFYIEDRNEAVSEVYTLYQDYDLNVGIDTYYCVLKIVLESGEIDAIIFDPLTITVTESDVPGGGEGDGDGDDDGGGSGGSGGTDDSGITGIQITSAPYSSDPGTNFAVGVKVTGKGTYDKSFAATISGNTSSNTYCVVDSTTNLTVYVASDDQAEYITIKVTSVEDTSYSASIKVYINHADKPVFTQNLPYPNVFTYELGETADTYTVVASVTDSGTLTYQWYCIENGVSTPISGATSPSYTPPVDKVGSRMYYCVVLNTTSTGLKAWECSTEIKIIVVSPSFKIGIAVGLALKGYYKG